MSDWKDKLRRGMADYTEAPPEGLWASVQESIAPVRRISPWWWTLAGAAAALAALLLVLRPAAEGERNEKRLAVVSGNSLPETDMTEGLPEGPAMPLELDAGNVGNFLADASGAGAPGLVEPCIPVQAASEPAASGIHVRQDTTSAGAGTDVDANGGETESAVAESGLANAKEAGKKGGDAVKADIDEALGSVGQPWTPSPQDIRLHRQQSPSVTLAMLAGGVPGGAATSSMTEYGMSAGLKMSVRSSTLPSVTALGRNKAVETSTSHAIAMRAGFMFQVGLGEHWGVESGLLLSTLRSSTTSATGSLRSTLDAKYNYVGMPLMAVWTPFRAGAFSLYASAGPMIEYGYNHRWETAEYIADNERSSDKGSENPHDLVFSAGLNAGTQFALGSFGSIFFQPGLSWYFARTGSQETYYTEHPFVFSLSGGLRFSF